MKRYPRSLDAGGLLIRYTARCAVAPSAILGLMMPEVSIVMKEFERFDVISLVSLSKRREMRGRYLPRC
jgi:hypothetical protein